MVDRPDTVDKAIAYIWNLPDTVLEPSEKESLAVLLADKPDAVARRYFFAPGPHLWVGTLQKLLKPIGILTGLHSLMRSPMEQGCLSTKCKPAAVLGACSQHLRPQLGRSTVSAAFRLLMFVTFCSMT